MKTLNNFQALEGLNRERIVRTEHQKLFLSSDYTGLTVKQKELYQRVLFGLSSYTEEQLFTMNSSKKKRIVKIHEKASKVLNVYKQQVINEKLKAAINIFDPKISNKGVFKLLTGIDIEPDPNFNPSLTFHQLDVTKTMIINKLLEFRLLPPNFASL